jgi:hypothetical protein
MLTAALVHGWESIHGIETLRELTEVSKELTDRFANKVRPLMTDSERNERAHMKIVSIWSACSLSDRQIPHG